MAKQRVVTLSLGRDDLEALKSAVEFTLATEVKTGQHRKRVKLYSLKRRIAAALLKLEG